MVGHEGHQYKCQGLIGLNTQFPLRKQESSDTLNDLFMTFPGQE